MCVGSDDSLQVNLKIKLSELLSLHQSCLPRAGLAKCLGDGYLYQNNHLFRSVRDEFLKLGYSLTTDDFCHYAVLPYASLPTILKEKKVPYFDNVTVLQEIEALHPNLFNCEELIKVKSNYTLHEAAHCLAANNLKDYSAERLSKVSNLHPESKQVFKIILAESFANTVESFANLYNQSSELRLFFEMNSYINHNKKMNSSLLQCCDLLGNQNTFRLMFISYLYSNCLYPELPQKMYSEILGFLIPDAALAKKALDSSSPRKVFNHASQLSLDFRVQTTGFFCAYSGYKMPLHQLLKIDIVEILKKTDVVQEFLNSKNNVFRLETN